MKKKLPKFKIEEIQLNIEKREFNKILNSKKPIIFDTNFLFTTFTFDIDIIEEIENLIGKNYSLYIYQGTIDELKNIQDKKDKNKKYLPLIISMLYRYNFKIIKSDIKYIDEQILSNLNEKVLIATNDKKLRKLINSKNYRVMFLKQKSYLSIE